MKLKHFLPTLALLMLYYSIVYPHILYGIIIWGSTYTSHPNKSTVDSKQSRTSDLFIELARARNAVLSSFKDSKNIGCSQNGNREIRSSICQSLPPNVFSILFPQSLSDAQTLY